MFHSVSPGSGTGAGRWALHGAPQLKDWLPIAAPRHRHSPQYVLSLQSFLCYIEIMPKI